MIGLNAFLNTTQIWYMPDGTKTSNRPKDGQVMQTLDSHGNGTTWQWDDLLESWHNVSSGKPTQQNTQTFYYQAVFSPTDLDNVDLSNEWCKAKVTKMPTLKCGCGSEKVNSPKHSPYCDKYDPAQ